MGANGQARLNWVPQLDHSSLIVGWTEDHGRVGAKVVDYLVRKLECRELGDIDPAGYFSLEGVSVQDDVVRFPQSKFYCCPERNLLLFQSKPPVASWHQFLSTVVDVAEKQCHVKEIYVVAGMIYLGPHTMPRELMGMANGPEMKDVLARYSLARDFDYQTPPGQRPSLRAFLLWVAQRRAIPAASLWVPVPFYLAAPGDPRAWRRMLEFFDARFGLGLDFADVDQGIAEQARKIAKLRNRLPEIDASIRRMESFLGLNEEEAQKLVTEMAHFLSKHD